MNFQPALLSTCGLLAVHLPFHDLSSYTSLLSFVVGLPIIFATYYQAWKTRQEAAAARRTAVLSENCLEFVLDDGSCINLVPLETLHSLPQPGDIVLLPGEGIDAGAGPYRVDSIEYIYAREEPRNRRPQQPRQARLAKAVAHVNHVLESHH